jgi:hypothetical protein
MAKARVTPELQKALKVLTTKKLAALHKIRGDRESFLELIGLFNEIIKNDENKMIAMVSDINSSDDAVFKMSKLNFWRGRINAIVLLHGLFINAEKQLEMREAKN